MSLQIYGVKRDNFFLDVKEILNGLDFPCCCCQFRTCKDSEDPCRTCDHNVNAVKEDV